MNSRNWLIGLVVITLTASVNYAIARPAIPEENRVSPVLVTLDNGETATGFYLSTSNRLYFVTARHVLINTDNATNWCIKAKTAKLTSYSSHIKQSENIKCDMNLEQLWLDKRLRCHPVHDVAVAHIGDIQQTTNAPPQLTFTRNYFSITQNPGNVPLRGTPANQAKRFDQLAVGNETYLFGFPTSIGMKQLAQLDYDTPLLRKGIVAGINASKGTIILDCPTYYGNSGSPIVEIETDGFVRRFNIIGVVSQFVPFVEEWVNVKHRYMNQTISNSGYTIAAPIDSVLELLQ